MRELTDVLLSSLTTLRIGGPARRLVEAATPDEVVATVADCDSRGEPVLLLGGGSNLVVADAGFDGTVVLVRTRGITATETPGGVQVEVAAGESWDGFVAAAVRRGHVGVEALSGIPGSTGATPMQNVGAYGQEVAQTLLRVEVWDRHESTARIFPTAECGFAYRHSRFKGEDRYVILAVTFALDRGEEGAPVRYAELARALGVAVSERAPLTAVRETVLGLRRRKGMVLDAGDPDTWSAGSFFTNPVLPDALLDRVPDDAPRYPDGEGRTKISAAWLIEHAGYTKGFGLDRRPAPVALSRKHTLALTNRGSATSSDLVALAREIRDGVRDRFGIELVAEPVFIGVGL